MTVPKHCVLTVAPAIILSYIAPLSFVSLFVLGSTFIDVDHYIDYVIRKRSLNLLHAHQYYVGLPDDFVKDKGLPLVLNVFHTVECMAILGILGLFYRGLLYLFFGCVFHFILDFVSLHHQNLLGIRAFSVIQYYLIKKKQAQ